MRALFYFVVFITPTVFVLIYRQEIRDYLVKQGLIRPATPKREPAAPPPRTPRDPSTETAPETIGRWTPPPGIAETPALPSDGDIERRIAEKYPMPDFESLEAIVGHWQRVPKRAYPELVTLKQPVEIELVIEGVVRGKSMLRVGRQAYPVALTGTTLTVSGSKDDATMTGTIPVDETDFKAQIEKRYEAWKLTQEGRIRKMRKEEKQRLLASEGLAGGPRSPEGKEEVLGQEPAVNSDGSVPPMIESIEAGEVKEIQLDRISYWRWIGCEEVGGADFWVGVVGYTADTLFGEMDFEGKALIRKGKVVRWVYSGSEEEIK